VSEDTKDRAGNGADLEAFEASMKDAIHDCSVLAKKTQNPLYAWAALCYLGWVRQGRISRGGVPGDLVIPEWCSEYFSQIAQNLIFLADGCDIRRDRQSDPNQGESDKPLAPQRATELVAAAISMGGKSGVNVFQDFQKNRALLPLHRRYSELRTGGMKFEDANALLASEAGGVDESVIRKKITKGLKLADGLRSSKSDGIDTGKT
jgi:hypothetical protein